MSQTGSLIAAARQDAQDNYVNPFETLSDEPIFPGDGPGLEGDVIAGFSSLSTAAPHESLPEFAQSPPRMFGSPVSAASRPTAATISGPPATTRPRGTSKSKKSKKARRRKTEPSVPNPFGDAVEPTGTGATASSEIKSAQPADDHVTDLLDLFGPPSAPASAAATTATRTEVPTATAPTTQTSDPFAMFDTGDAFFDDPFAKLGSEDAKDASERASKTTETESESLSGLETESKVSIPSPPRRSRTKARASAPATAIEKAQHQLRQEGTIPERERGVDPRAPGVARRVREDAIPIGRRSSRVHDSSSTDDEDYDVSSDDEDSDSYGDDARGEVRECPTIQPPTGPAPQPPTKSGVTSSAATASADTSSATSSADTKSTSTVVSSTQAGTTTMKEFNVLPELKRGTALLKYGARGYPHFRQFNLSKDHNKLVWFTQKKKLNQSAIDVGAIDEIITGQHTKEFKRIGWTTLAPASFSIMYAKRKKSLNLVAKSVDEMRMWTKALRKLRDMKRKGQDVSLIRELMVDVDFRDRNRPTTRKHSGRFVRGHETKEMEVDESLKERLIKDVEELKVKWAEVHDLSRNETIMKSHEATSIIQILSEIEERIEELRHEVKNTRNTKIAENDVWRTRIDLEAVREKIEVLSKSGKKRRWSIF